MSGYPMKRRELLRWCGQGIAIAPFVSLIGCGNKAPTAVQNPGGAPYQGTDDQLLDDIERGSFET